MYAQDYDEMYPNPTVKYQSLISPYVSRMEIFKCALDAKSAISYSLNMNLQNRSLKDVANPTHTVLIYEGHNGVVDYRHEGRAAIALADGHARLMTETEVKALIWKLPPPAPKKAPAKRRSGKKG